MSFPQRPINFWDFIAQSTQADQVPGQGVDHNAMPSFQSFMSGYPFGTGGPHGYAGSHEHFGHGPHGPHGPGPRAAPHNYPTGFEWAGHNYQNHHHRGHQHDNHHRFGDNDGGSSSSTTEVDRDSGTEKQKRELTPDTMSVDDVPDPEEVAPEEGHHHQHPRQQQNSRQRPFGFGRGRNCRGSWGGGRCGRGGGYGGTRNGGGFDLPDFLRNLASSHPLASELFSSQSRPQAGADNFAPPVDIFNTEKAYVLHVALPGAKKEDIGIDWDADRRVLRVAGVVHRPGSEDFLSTLTSAERRVGLFERKVTLPLEGAEERDEIDGQGITAKMEDGVLIITVPRVEKEWTQIHKVDIA